MKSEGRSFPRSVRPSQPPIPGIVNPLPAESKCLACGQSVDATQDQSVERQDPSLPCPSAQAPDAIDMEKFLHFSQQLYAHALTLQEVIRNDGEATYEALRSRYDRQAAQQFEIFYHTLKRSSGFRVRRGVRE